MVLFTVQTYHLLHDILFLLPLFLYLIHIDNLSHLVVTNHIALVYTNYVLFVNLFCFYFPLPLNMLLSVSYKGYGLQNLNSYSVLLLYILNVIYINIFDISSSFLHNPICFSNYIAKHLALWNFLLYTAFILMNFTNAFCYLK